MAATVASREKTAVLVKLEKLLDVAGIETPWGVLESDLRRLPLRTLIALHYRTERTMSNAYEDGAHAARPNG